MTQSKTPRVDAAENEFQKVHGMSSFGVVSLARTLELEVNELRKELSEAQQWLDSEPDWKSQFLKRYQNLETECEKAIKDRDSLKQLAEKMYEKFKMYQYGGYNRHENDIIIELAQQHGIGKGG